MQPIMKKYELLSMKSIEFLEGLPTHRHLGVLQSVYGGTCI